MAHQVTTHNAVRTVNAERDRAKAAQVSAASRWEDKAGAWTARGHGILNTEVSVHRDRLGHVTGHLRRGWHVSYLRLMRGQGSSAIAFTLNGTRYELTRAEVERRLEGLTPDAIRKHAVRVNDIWFPVIQAFEAATGIPRSEFISYTARRHLAALGYEVSGDVEPRTIQSSIGADAPGAVDRVPRTTVQAGEEWHTEANVQASLVTALASDGWRVLAVANTATKEPGVDVIAARQGQTVGVEVKGFPSRGYADPSRAGEVKPTSPSTQAGHWYSQAVLAAMRLRGRQPEWSSVIALPDFPRYRHLYSETSASLAAAEIAVWWVSQDGTVQM